MAAESFDVELRLINGGLMSPAKQAASALDELEKKADKVGSAFEDALSGKVKGGFDDTRKAVKGFSDDLQRAMSQAAKLSSDPKGFQMLAKARAQMSEQRKKLLEEAGLGKTPPPGGGNGGGNGGFGSGFAGNLGFGNLASATAVGALVAGGIMKAADYLVSAAEKTAGIFIDGIKKAFEEGSKFEQLKLGYKLSLHGKEGQESLADIGRFSKQTGYDDDAIAKMLLPLRRAGFSRGGARSAFAAATDIAAGRGEGGNLGTVQGLLEGFQHIMLKGGVQERRLPEMGVNVKQFYGDLSKQLHITADEAKKAAEEGRINPQLLLNTIYKGVEKTQGGQLGTGGMAYGKTFEARFNKLKDLPNQYLKTVAESPAFGAVTETLGKVLERLDPDSPTGLRIINSLNRAFESVVGFFDELTTNEGLDRLETSVHVIADTMESAVSMSIELAKYFKEAAELGFTIMKPLTYLSDLAHKGDADTGNRDLDRLVTSRHQGMVNDDDYAKFWQKMPSSQRDDLFSRLAAPDKRDAIAALNRSVDQKVNINVNVGAGVDANNAKQIGQQVGDSAGHAAAKVLGQTAQEAGAR